LSIWTWPAETPTATAARTLKRDNDRIPSSSRPEIEGEKERRVKFDGNSGDNPKIPKKGRQGR
jgi:hypothetical protein